MSKFKFIDNNRVIKNIVTSHAEGDGVNTIIRIHLVDGQIISIAYGHMCSFSFKCWEVMRIHANGGVNIDSISRFETIAKTNKHVNAILAKVNNVVVVEI